MLPTAIKNLIADFASLPGVGNRSATRIVLYLLQQKNFSLSDFSMHLKDLRLKVKYCEQCFNYTEEELCDICKNERRDQGKILVVENALEIENFETIGYSGLYHVLGGLISPVQGVGASEIRIKELLNRVRVVGSEVEVILACATSLEGEATSNYIKTVLAPQSYPQLKTLSVLARGLPSNTSVEYQDPNTLKYSFNNRQTLGF